MSLALHAAPQRFTWLAGQIAHERDFGRFALWLPILAALGVALAERTAPMPPLPWMIATAGLSAALWLTASLRGAALSAALLAGLTAVSLGAISFEASHHLYGAKMLTRATSVSLTGRVVAADSRAAGGRIVVAPDDPALPGRVRLSVRSGTLPAVGSTIAVGARLFPLRGPTIPGGYDPARRLHFDGIGATGFTYGAPKITAPPDKTLRARLAALREMVGDRVMAAGGEHAGFARALLTGARGLIDETTTTALRHSGLGHILAISGLHMGLVAGGIFAVVRLCLALIPAIALRFDTRALAAIAGLCAGTLYLGLSGGAVATQRAHIMLSIALLAVLLKRPALTMRAVAVAGTLLIALDPVAVLEPGFQMSFLAVIALVGTYEAWSMGRLRRRLPFLVVFFGGVALTALVAGAATAIPSAYHFQRLAPFSLLANVAAMPIFSMLAMPAGIVALAAMPFGLEALPLAVMDFALGIVVWIAAHVAALGGDGGAVGLVPAGGALLAAAGLLFLAIMTARWRLFGVLPIVAGVVWMAAAPPPDLLIAADGKSAAARTPAGVRVLEGSGNYPADQFRKAFGAPAAPKGGQCDADGCVLKTPHGALSMAKHPRAALEDCHRATVVVSANALPRCPATLVLGRAALTQKGAAMVWLSPFAVRHARPNGPTKPWHVPLPPRR
ncbi:MAG: ComEC/Rec2 family competence protein [Pseudomonadota bacterium]